VVPEPPFFRILYKILITFVNCILTSIFLTDFKQFQNCFQGVVTAATRGPLESTTKIVPGAVTFQNTEAMTKVRFSINNKCFLMRVRKYTFNTLVLRLQMSNVSPVGTLAYIIDEQALLVRVNNGWQYIAVSIKLHYYYYYKFAKYYNCAEFLFYYVL